MEKNHPSKLIGGPPSSSYACEFECSWSWSICQLREKPSEFQNSSKRKKTHTPIGFNKSPLKNMFETVFRGLCSSSWVKNRAFFLLTTGKRQALRPCALVGGGCLKKPILGMTGSLGIILIQKKRSYKSTFIQPSMGSRSFVILIGFSYNICRSMNGLMFKKINGKKTIRHIWYQYILNYTNHTCI